MIGMRFDEKSFVIELEDKRKYDFLKELKRMMQILPQQCG